MKMKNLFNPLAGRRWLPALVFTASLGGIASAQTSPSDASVPAMQVGAFLSSAHMLEQECQLNTRMACPSPTMLTWTPTLANPRGFRIMTMDAWVPGRPGTIRYIEVLVQAL